MTILDDFESQHNTQIYNNAKIISSRLKEAPNFKLDDHFRSTHNLYGILRSNEASAEMAYRQFRRWAYVAVNAIARRATGYEWCAGDITEATPNPERSHKGWKQRKSEEFKRFAASSSYLAENVPSGVRGRIGGSIKAPSGTIDILNVHPVLDLLNKPNSVQKKHEFIYFLVSNLYLTGEAYVLGGETEGSSSLWCVPTSWVTARHEEGLFSGIDIRPNESIEGLNNLPPELWTRIHFPDPSDPKKVLSPLLACFDAVRADEKIQDAHIQAFENGVFPKVALSVGRDVDATGRKVMGRAEISPEQREQIVNSVMTVWMNSAAQGLPAILDAMIDDVKVLQNTVAEMDFLNSGEIIKSRIFQAMGVNPIIVGEVTASNKAQAVVAEKNFIRNVMNPLVDSISVCLTDWVGSWYDNPQRLVVWLERDEMPDEEAKISKWNFALDAGAVSQDLYRQEILQLPASKENDDVRSSLIDAQGWTLLQNLIAAVSEFKVSYDAAVEQVMMFFDVDESRAKLLLGEEPEEPEVPEQLQDFVGGVSDPDRILEEDTYESGDIVQQPHRPNDDNGDDIDFNETDEVSDSEDDSKSVKAVKKK